MLTPNHLPPFHSDDLNREIIPTEASDLPLSEIRKQFVTKFHKLLDAIDLKEQLIITDAHIFPKGANSEYKKFLKNILSRYGSKLQEIHFLVQNGYNQALYQSIKGDLERNFTHLQIFISERDDIHDRYWLSSHSKKGVYIGGSLNGIGRKMMSFGAMPDADAEKLLKTL
jgi:hypothetical protein